MKVMWPRLCDLPEYQSWRGMKKRCSSTDQSRIRDYSARGIYVCDRWLKSFRSFLADMGRRPTPNHSIDRIDNNGPYSPENCRWATQREQNSNQRRNHLVTIDGVTKTLMDWANHVNAPYVRLRKRLEAGWDAKTAIFAQGRQHRRPDIQRVRALDLIDSGASYSRVSKEVGVSVTLVHAWVVKAVGRDAARNRPRGVKVADLYRKRTSAATLAYASDILGAN